MNIPFQIKELLEKKCGRKIRNSSDCEFLSLDIESKAREHVGVTTIKRMLGLVNEERVPRQGTLDVIAHYLGFEDWNVLYKTYVLSTSSFSSVEGTINSEDVQINSEVFLSYNPGRELIIRYQGDNKYEVVSSKNSKLTAGDIITVFCIIRNFPLIVQEVVRDGESLGPYKAAIQTGLEKVRVYTDVK